jgi:hypothetical protein
MIEGNVLICKKDLVTASGVNIIGRKYVIKYIEKAGNKNIYVSTDLSDGPRPPYSSGTVCYSSVKIPDNLLYSTKYIHDYFDELAEVRNMKLNELGI